MYELVKIWTAIKKSIEMTNVGDLIFATYSEYIRTSGSYRGAS